MQIPKNQLDKWKALKSRGDGRKIMAANPGISATDISRAFAGGRCSDDTFNAIATYYKEKNRKVQEMAI